MRRIITTPATIIAASIAFFAALLILGTIRDGAKTHRPPASRLVH